MSRTVTVEQLDAFAAPTRVAVIQAPEAPRRAPRKVQRSQLQAHQMSRTVTVEQLDAFAAPTRVAVIQAPEAPRRAPRKVQRSQLQAHQTITPKQPTISERCRWEVAGNSTFGRTRQEIADRTGIKLQTVCGAVHRLIQEGRCFEPVVGYTADRRPVHYTRDGRNVVVAALYQDFDWLTFGQRTGKVPA